MDRTPLDEPIAGDPIRAELIAELARRAATSGSVAEGYGDDYTGLTDHINWPRNVCWASNGTGGAIPAWSLFGLTGSEEPDDPQTFVAQKLGANGSSLHAFTNGSIPVAAGADQKFECRSIESLGPFRVGISGQQPIPGYPCGSVLGEFGVTARNCGLMCLSAADEDNIITVVSANMLGTMWGEVVTEITGALIDEDGIVTCGNGTVKLFVRTPSTDVMAEEADPATGVGAYVVHVFNLEVSKAIVGAKVYVEHRLGIGLVLQKQSELTKVAYYQPRPASWAGDDFASGSSCTFSVGTSWPTGIFKWLKKAGDETKLGIKHIQETDALLGNFICTRAGRYEMLIDCQVQVTVPYTTITRNTGLTALTASGGITVIPSQHQHTYESYENEQYGPELELRVCQTTQGNALFDEAGDRILSAMQAFPKWQSGWNGYRLAQVTAVFILALDLGERFNLTARIFGNSLGGGTITLAPRLVLCYLGEQVSVADTIVQE